MSKKKSNGNGNGNNATITATATKKQHMQQLEVAPQYENSIKVEGTRDGPRVTIHAYGDNEEETRTRAVRLYKETLEDLEKVGFRSST